MTEGALPEEEYKTLFARRKGWLRGAYLVAAITAILSLAWVSGWLPDELRWWVRAVSSFWIVFVVLPVSIWAYRCPACGAGIRLDGKTCSACKRVFP
jgi:hypothetical protein